MVGVHQLATRRPKMKPPQCVAVIGAGPSGLTAAKTCLESGIEAVVYEQSDSLGGLWHFRETSQEGQPSVMRSTIINSSKELTAFSDFPAPASFPNYMHHSRMLEYLKLYSDHFDVTGRIRTRHLVQDVRPTEDHPQTGRYLPYTLANSSILVALNWMDNDNCEL